MSLSLVKNFDLYCLLTDRIKILIITTVCWQTGLSVISWVMTCGMIIIAGQTSPYVLQYLPQQSYQHVAALGIVLCWLSRHLWYLYKLCQSWFCISCVLDIDYLACVEVIQTSMVLQGCKYVSSFHQFAVRMNFSNSLAQVT